MIETEAFRSCGKGYVSNSGKRNRPETIADELGKELSKIEKIIMAQRRADGYNGEEICRILVQ